jgi:hypothetical protein
MTTPALLTAVQSPAVGPAKPHADCCRDVGCLLLLRHFVGGQSGHCDWHRAAECLQPDDGPECRWSTCQPCQVPATGCCTASGTRTAIANSDLASVLDPKVTVGSRSYIL